MSIKRLPPAVSWINASAKPGEVMNANGDMMTKDHGPVKSGQVVVTLSQAFDALSYGWVVAAHCHDGDLVVYRPYPTVNRKAR